MTIIASDYQEIKKVTQSDLKETPPKIAKDESVEKSSDVEISERAKKIQNIDDVVKAAPDVRTEKVEELKKEIKEGTYNINSDKIAQKILEEIVSTVF
ncbi:MAG: flagellar biosynthesis anti-sigma factor FlgM [Nitrospinota bacterium]